MLYEVITSIDKVLTNRFIGFPIFLLFIWAMFQLTFTLGAYPMDWIDAEEVIFVDSLSYAVQKGEGGRMIILAWVFPPEGGRDSLNAPVPVELIAYADNTKQLQARVMTEP